MKAQWEDMAAMILIGDGVLNLTYPRRHSGLWNCGPASYRKFATELETHPQVTRVLGLGLVALGIWLGYRAVKSA